MIRDIFLPTHIKGYYLFSKRFVGIVIGKNSIQATQARAYGRSVSVDAVIHHPLETEKNNDQRIIEGLQELKEQLTLPSSIRTPLPSNQVVFKELTLPFTTYDQIKQIVRFEVEPLLPFALSDAIVDFIITKKNEASSQIMVAAALKQHIAQHLSYFEQADLYPSTITVDLFDVYGLYELTPHTHDGVDVLVDLSSQTTRLASITAGQLRVVRTLSHGVTTLAKQMAEKSGVTAHQAMEQLIRTGIESEQDELFDAFWQKIQFAINALSNQSESKKISHLLLFGYGTHIKNIAEIISKKSGIECKLFNADKLKENSRLNFNNNIKIEPYNLTSIAAAVPTPLMRNFNLCREEFAHSNTSLFVKQIITALVFILLLFGGLMAHTFWQSASLKSAIQQEETEAVEALREHFPDMPEDIDVLEDSIDAAEELLRAQEEMWMAFSTQARMSFLEYLLELSTRINKQELGFTPKQLQIKNGTVGEITLDAKVKDYEALKKLELVLRESTLFSSVQGVDHPEFSMKIKIDHDRKGK